MTTPFPPDGPVTLRTALVDSPVVAALKNGKVASPLVSFDYAPLPSAVAGFKPMVREARFDAGELAIVTFLQAKAYGKPLVLLPAVIVGRFQHQCIATAAGPHPLRPKDLEGRHVAVRSYTQTTGVWVRAILQHEYGVDLDRLQWGTFEDGHVAEYKDPPNCTRFPAGGKTMERMTLDGDVAAMVHGGAMAEGLVPVIPDPQAAARAWYDRHGIVPINHMFVVSETLARARPDVVDEVYRLLRASRQAVASDGIDLMPFGIARNRKSLETVIGYAVEQKLIPRRLGVDELFGDLAGRFE